MKTTNLHNIGTFVYFLFIFKLVWLLCVRKVQANITEIKLFILVYSYGYSYSTSVNQSFTFSELFRTRSHVKTKLVIALYIVEEIFAYYAGGPNPGLDMDLCPLCNSISERLMAISVESIPLNLFEISLENSNPCPNRTTWFRIKTTKFYDYCEILVIRNSIY